MRERVEKNSEGRMKLIGMMKSDGQDVNVNGESRYELHYVAELEFLEDADFSPTAPVLFKASRAGDRGRTMLDIRTYKRGEKIIQGAKIHFVKMESGWVVRRGQAYEGGTRF